MVNERAVRILLECILVRIKPVSGEVFITIRQRSCEKVMFSVKAQLTVPFNENTYSTVLTWHYGKEILFASALVSLSGLRLLTF